MALPGLAMHVQLYSLLPLTKNLTPRIQHGHGPQVLTAGRPALIFAT